jgi:hypothetical protein
LFLPQLNISNIVVKVEAQQIASSTTLAPERVVEQIQLCQPFRTLASLKESRPDGRYYEQFTTY